MNLLSFSYRSSIILLIWLNTILIIEVFIELITFLYCFA
nr:MAG TPA: hypothetical protein [Crassvirales sp.]